MRGRSSAERKLAIDPAPVVDIRERIPECRCALEAGVIGFGCLECGASCCADCAIVLESVAYCRRCATAVLEATVVLQSGSFELY